MTNKWSNYYENKLRVVMKHKSVIYATSGNLLQLTWRAQQLSGIYQGADLSHVDWRSQLLIKP
jgi:hypothetical protein